MENKNRKVVLFDLDGVLLDTETQYTEFWQMLGVKFHPEIPNFGMVIKGQTLVQIYDKYFNDQPEIQKMLTEEVDRFEKGMTYNYIAGAEQFLKELRKEGYNIGIVTSSDNCKMAKVKEAHPELYTMVDHIFTANSFSHSKPHPECYLTGAAYFNASPEDCIVFEDSMHGLEAGNRAGMKVIGLATTYSAAEIEDKAKAIIPDFKDFSVEKMETILR